ncbi:hypothetical protein PIB30_060085 [Stylosanthes scabra]|uniref:AT-hook motif nuclear-localized protein n=1 Tax=Stylosanthes scabra TaxID=79078 RepID=A0ABU6WIN1_9FABA|nr:hypothetical protein [Stylosanthes scabra]
MAETLNNSVSASMLSLSPPKQEQESAMMNMEVETSDAATPPTPQPPQPVAVATTGSLELFEDQKKKKKKRGRPRKYDSNRNMILTSPPNAVTWTMTMTMPFSSPPPKPHSEFGGSNNEGKSSEIEMEIFVSMRVTRCGGFATISGGGFTPHMVNVFAGEDVARKIMSFFEKGFWSKSGDMRTGGLSVVLESSSSDVFGGTVAGLLTAASPVQLVLGSFRPHAPRRKRGRGEHTTSQLVVAAPIAVCPDTMAARNLASQANPEQSQREFAAATWNGSEEFPDRRITPDINISLSDV